MIAIKTSIKQMPEYCDDCRWYECRPHPMKGWTESCALMNQCMDDDQPDEWIYDGNGRPKACPLVEVKTPHGRLIDADKLEEGFKRAIGTYLPKDPTRHMDIVNGSECRGWTQGLTAVQEAETIIEAED